MRDLNRLANAKNEYQGKFKRVLCVCAAGVLRSPTAALVLSQEPFNFNTRAAGVDNEFALVRVDNVLLYWADEVVCMTSEEHEKLVKLFECQKPIVCLDIEDSYDYRDPRLMDLIKTRYEEAKK